MRLHRFYVNPQDTELRQNFWAEDERLYRQWIKVLRYKVGSQVVLFDGVLTERLYEISEISDRAILLSMMTELEVSMPVSKTFLFFSLLKKDKNDWIIQKCTELGVSSLVPVLAERSEKTGFNIDRYRKISIEASEQCGRSDIPEIYDPIRIDKALAEYADIVNLFTADKSFSNEDKVSIDNNEKGIGVFVGPEGGWTQGELAMFEGYNINKMWLGQFTLRAETACVIASNKLANYRIQS